MIKPPSVLKRTVWTIGYNVILSAIFFPAFYFLYTLDDVAKHLDNLTILGLTALSLDFVLCVGLFWFAFRQAFKDINLVRYLKRSLDHEKEVVKRGAKTSYEGPEGTGKTLNVANDTLLFAVEKDREMRLEYYKKLPFRDKLTQEGDIDFKVLEESFNFYERNKQNIPHFMSNFTVIYNGQKNYPFSMEYLDQTRRLAEGFALGLTETANILPNAWSRIPGDEKKDVHKLKTKSETLSLSRQYFNLTITYDEQRTGEVFLGLRALNSQNIELTRRETVLEPQALILLRNMIEDKVIFPLGEEIVKLRERLFDVYGNLYRLDRELLHKYNKLLKKLERFSKFHIVLCSVIARIGFYVFYYNEKESQEASKTINRDKSFVSPRFYPFRFDTRGLKYDYKLYRERPEFRVPSQPKE